ncbi:hypothetical protein [Nocardioides sp. GY 10127]|uniref:hypothetical protein n=1 Tax=Nocardioides sp. GY 10127 TaxID=2569762 RepID=UPI0010A7A7C5|nr:hypothetical protein [Nocardioides sp. GY 10127]TIC79473.1 hypothetical protein E8D37_18080 [Nocardioides sp. GY 10127]
MLRTLIATLTLLAAALLPFSATQAATAATAGRAKVCITKPEYKQLKPKRTTMAGVKRIVGGEPTIRRRAKGRVLFAYKPCVADNGTDYVYILFNKNHKVMTKSWHSCGGGRGTAARC